jgi:hypothetical protein
MILAQRFTATRIVPGRENRLGTVDLDAGTEITKPSKYAGPNGLPPVWRFDARTGPDRIWFSYESSEAPPVVVDRAPGPPDARQPASITQDGGDQDGGDQDGGDTAPAESV